MLSQAKFCHDDDQNIRSKDQRMLYSQENQEIKNILIWIICFTKKPENINDGSFQVSNGKYGKWLVMN